MPAKQQPALVRHMHDDVVELGGRLIVCDYSRRAAGDAIPLVAELQSWGFGIGGEAAAASNAQGDCHARVAWIHRDG